MAHNINIAICDDDEQYRITIDNYMKKISETMPFLQWSFYNSAEKFLDAFEKNKFNIAVIDIDLGGSSGIDLANSIRERDRNIIIFYMSSHTEYALNCFKARPSNFWVKPPAFDTIYNDIECAAEDISIGNKYITITENRKKIMIRYEDIVYIEAWDKQSVIRTIKCDHKTNRSLVSFQKELDNELFARVNQTYIVNLDYVISYKNKQIVLDGIPGSLSIGRTYAKGLEQKWTDHKLKRSAKY